MPVQFITEPPVPTPDVSDWVSSFKRSSNLSLNSSFYSLDCVNIFCSHSWLRYNYSYTCSSQRMNVSWKVTKTICSKKWTDFSSFYHKDYSQYTVPITPIFFTTNPIKHNILLFTRYLLISYYNNIANMMKWI